MSFFENHQYIGTEISLGKEFPVTVIGQTCLHLHQEHLRRSFCLTEYRYGPGTLPMLGNALKFLQPRHLLFEWFIQCQRKFGFETFTISIPSLPSGVVVNDPKTLEYVLRNESTITKGEFFRRRSWDLFGAS